MPGVSELQCGLRYIWDMQWGFKFLRDGSVPEEEVQSLGLFKAVEQAQAMQEFVDQHLPGENQARCSGIK